MRWRNTQEKYGYMTVALHWTTALLIYGMFGLGLWMVTLGYYDSGTTRRQNSIKALA